MRDEKGLLDMLDGPGLIDLHSQLCQFRSATERVQLLQAWLLRRLALGAERSKVGITPYASLRRDRVRPTLY